MRASEFVTEAFDQKVVRMGRLSKDGRVVRILKHRDTVGFSPDQGWLLIDITPGERLPKNIKWIPDTTEFDWVREFNSDNEFVQDLKEFAPNLDPDPWGGNDFNLSWSNILNIYRKFFDGQGWDQELGSNSARFFNRDDRVFSIQQAQSPQIYHYAMIRNGKHVMKGFSHATLNSTNHVIDRIQNQIQGKQALDEISRDRLERYLSRAGRQVDSRQERMALARQRLSRSYEIYRAEEPTKIVDRFEADTPADAQRYYQDYIERYQSDVDYDLRLRRATGIMEVTMVNTQSKSKREHLDLMPNDGKPIPPGEEADYLGNLVADLGDGYQLWVWVNRGTVTYYVFDTDTRTSQLGTTGRPYASNPDSFVIQGVYSGPRNQYRAADLYAFLILDQGLTLISDNKQSEGGYRVWQELERRYGRKLNIHGFDTRTDEPVNVTTQDEPDTHVSRADVKRAGPKMKKELGSISRDLRFVASAR